MLKQVAWNLSGRFYKKAPQRAARCDFKKAQTIAIVFNASHKRSGALIAQVESLAMQLKKDNKKVKMLGYHSNQFDSIPTAYIDWFTDSDFSFWGQPKEKTLISFCQHYFDIIYLINFDKFTAGKVLMRNCNYGFLVTNWNTKHNTGDLVVKLNPHSFNSINQLLDYSKILVYNV